VNRTPCILNKIDPSYCVHIATACFALELQRNYDAFLNSQDWTVACLYKFYKTTGHIPLTQQ